MNHHPEAAPCCQWRWHGAASLVQKAILMNVNEIIDEMQTMRKKDVRRIGQASRDILGIDKSNMPLTDKIMRLLADAPEMTMQLTDIKRHVRNYHTVMEVVDAVHELRNLYYVSLREPDDSTGELERYYVVSKNKGGRKPISGNLIVQRLSENEL